MVFTVQVDMLSAAKRIEKDMIALRRDFHMYPELGLEETRTVGVIETFLQSLGIETKRVAGTGVIGVLKGKAPGKTVALRADMDALPLPDKKQVEYASKIPGKMHACGHDFHTAGLLGAAVLLSQMKEQFVGNVKFLFQPAEETTQGAQLMIADGVLDNPKVDAVFGLHTTLELETGKIGVSYDMSYAAGDSFDIVIYGQASHGAAPHRGVDAIVAASHVICALQTVVSRTVDPTDSAVVTVGTIAGGYQRNIIADKVELTGTIRTLNPETREKTQASLKKIIEGVAESLGVRGEVKFTPSCPYLVNHNAMADLVKAAAEELLGKDEVTLLPKPTMGVEDFACYVQMVPGAYYRIGVKNDVKGFNQPGHSSLYDLDEAALPVAAAMHTKIALAYLATP